METMTQCIKESMRMYPPVPLISRMLTEDWVMDGKVIPAGTSATLNIHAVHNNADIWPDPNQFIPDRFSKENSADRDPFFFTPFAAGSR